MGHTEGMEPTERPLLTGDQARAGRALAQVSLDVVGHRAGLDPDQLRSFERGGDDLGAAQNDALREALEDHGVQFLAEDDDAGYGVRQKFNQSKVKRIENWENEGGPAYEDDI